MDQDIVQYLVFFALAGLTLVAALAVVTLKNIFRSALSLVMALIGVAGIYMLLRAEFLAVVQVLIYVGAVTVLILFTIMLTHRLADRYLAQFTARWWMAAPLCLALFGLLTIVVYSTAWPPPPPETLPADPVAALGVQLMTTYLLPFEMASVLLLAALVGAIVVAWSIRDRLPVVEQLEIKIAEARSVEEAAEAADAEEEAADAEEEAADAEEEAADAEEEAADAEEDAAGAEGAEGAEDAEGAEKVEGAESR